ncbi:MAG: hypothetical protein CSA34_01660 [Desulfobulbus propionicus]|nr:MAG: hypothetical protein CSA34_01660 [Desulfobulbus propionicus]
MTHEVMKFIESLQGEDAGCGQILKGEPEALPVSGETGRKRKKLWEIKKGYHCSVMGICLRRQDLRRIAKKKVFCLDTGYSDYEVHSFLSSYSSSRTPKTRALQKILDTKYRVSLKRYAVASDDDELRTLWQEDVQKKNIAGAYWAVMTHPAASKELIDHVYGQSHMISFDIFGDQQRERKRIDDLQARETMLSEVLGSERQMYLEEKTRLEQELERLQVEAEKARQFVTDNEQLRKRCEALESGSTLNSVAEKNEALQEMISGLQAKNTELSSMKDAAQNELGKLSAQLEQLQEQVQALEAEKIAWQETDTEHRHEIAALETALMQRSPVTSCCGNENCADLDTERCPGPDLCGKTVLYVGGLHRLVSHYRILVEQHGGQFMHHDGGKEAARSMLPKMLATADVVLCPVDCVSHNACTCVKKMCKRYQKPFVMMRSSGLSSLMKGLTDVVQ